MSVSVFVLCLSHIYLIISVWTERDKDRQRETKTHTETDRQTDRQTKTEKQIDWGQREEGFRLRQANCNEPILFVAALKRRSFRVSINVDEFSLLFFLNLF